MTPYHINSNNTHIRFHKIKVVGKQINFRAIPSNDVLDVLGHGGTEQHHLLGLGALFEKPVDLLLEVWGKKLISLIKNQKLYIVNFLEQ